MRSIAVVLLLFTIVLILIIASGRLAIEKTLGVPTVQGNQRVTFLTDQQAGVVRIVIDGKEVARIDATGLYVHGDIAYTGTITDGLPLRVSGESLNAR
ncbi:hypothetical protein [Sinorhizobium meliloti]|uniref:hypothetical protein n=1 Tax=Rhizobium meliloti TaxID=382 RepID=UPI000FDB0335|nr:hypothetical protein [Sinorhizobium meliloti]RVI30870.1 hypothetical protein CN207_07455 [Sinorhizobium meliloti]